MKKTFFLIIFLLPVLLCMNVHPAEINPDNYIEFLGKEIRFRESLPSGEKYSIGSKNFNPKEYSGKTFTVSDILFDEKDNMTLLLTHENSNGKIDSLKIPGGKTINLRNIDVAGMEDKKGKSQRKKQNNAKSGTNADSTDENVKTPVVNPENSAKSSKNPSNEAKKTVLKQPAKKKTGKNANQGECPKCGGCSAFPTILFGVICFFAGKYYKEYMS